MPRRRALRAASAILLAGLAWGCGDITSFSLAVSTWGGTYVSITVTTGGGAVHFECAEGRIDERITLRDGRFDVRGVYWPGTGGPVGVDTTRVPRPARYLGTVREDRMTLMVILTDTGETLGIYYLQKGRSPGMVRCL